MDTVKESVNKLLNGYACAQSILATYCDLYGLDSEMAKKLSAGFGGGMGVAGTCGAVTGAYMVIGLEFTKSDCKDSENRKNVHKAVADFNRRFNEVHDSISCKGLLGYDFTTPDGGKVIKKRKLFKTLCPKFVKTSATILEELNCKG